MRKSIVFFALLAVLACSKETPSEQLVSSPDKLVVNIGNDDTRTLLGQENSGKTPVLWMDGDCIMVTDGSSHHSKYSTKTADIATGGKSAVFTYVSGSASTDAGAFVAVYPYSKVLASTLTKTVVSLPATFEYTKDSFASGTNPMVALCADRNSGVCMRNVLGCVRFSIKGEGQKVSRVELVDSNVESALWGNLTVNTDIEKSTFTTSVSNTKESPNVLSINCSSEIELGETAVDFYFPVPAGALASGFQLNLYDASGNLIGKKETKNACTAVEGVIKETPVFAVMAPKATRVSIIGDSISTFAGYIPEGYVPYYPVAGRLDYVEQTYWHKLIYKYMSNAVLDKNIAYGGTTVASVRVHDFNFNFIEQGGVGNPDVIIIHGGTNDNNVANSPGLELVPGVDAKTATEAPYLGDVFKLVDRANTVTKAQNLPGGTFCEAYAKLIKICSVTYPDVKIVCVIGDWLCVGLEKSIIAVVNHFSNAKYVDFVVDGAPDAVNIPKIGAGCHPVEEGMEYMAKTIYTQHGSWIDPDTEEE